MKRSQTWKCSCMLLMCEYCCLNWAWKPVQSTVNGLKDLYYEASFTNVRQKCWTLDTFWKHMSVHQSSVFYKCASSCGLPENTGLKCYEFKYGTGPAMGNAGCTGGAGGTTDCNGGTTDCSGGCARGTGGPFGIAGSTGGAGGSAMLNYFKPNIL